MTTTVGNQTGRGRLPVQSRDRRPALAALALLLIVGGGLGAGLIVYRTGQQVEVLSAQHTIHQGDRVQAGDFTTVRISGASGNVINATNEHAFVGTTAVTEIHAGTLLNRNMFYGGGVVPKGGQLVGLYLAVGQRTDTSLTPGSIVQLWDVQKSGSGAETKGAVPMGRPVLVYQARGASGDGSVHVDVLVDSNDTQLGLMVSDAATNQVAVTQHSLDTKPEIQLQGKP